MGDCQQSAKPTGKRVAKRLGSEAGVQLALDYAHRNLQSMGEERRERFLAAYDGWLAPQIRDLAQALSPP